jgi:hypothetical protein
VIRILFRNLLRYGSNTAALTDTPTVMPIRTTSCSFAQVTSVASLLGSTPVPDQSGGRAEVRVTRRSRALEHPADDTANEGTAAFRADAADPTRPAAMGVDQNVIRGTAPGRTSAMPAGIERIRNGFHREAA